MRLVARCVAGLLLVLPALGASGAEVLGLDALDEPIPAFTLDSADGRSRYDSKAVPTRPVLLHFWATWCVPCRRELPRLAALAKAQALPVDVVLVAVDEEASAQAIARFAREVGVELPVYVATGKPETRVFWTWGVPATYLLDPHGQLRGRLLGPRDWEAAATRSALGVVLQQISSTPVTGVH